MWEWRTGDVGLSLSFSCRRRELSRRRALWRRWRFRSPLRIGASGKAFRGRLKCGPLLGACWRNVFEVGSYFFIYGPISGACWRCSKVISIIKHLTNLALRQDPGVQELQEAGVSVPVRQRLHGPDTIPASFGDLPLLAYIDLSSNNLTTGHWHGIPMELQNLKLALLNVSYSHSQLSGRVPTSLTSGLPVVFLQGNPELCGPGLPNDCDAKWRKHQGLALAATVASLVTGVTLLAIGAFAGLHGSKCSPWKLVLFHPIKITGEELFAGLYGKNVIGRGAFPKVYLIGLQDGQAVAVKSLVNSGKLTFRAVKKEMKLLARIRHKNIAKILGFCYSEGEISVIYEQLQRGSLQDLICAPKFRMGCRDQPSVLAGIDRRFLLRSTVGSCRRLLLGSTASCKVSSANENCIRRFGAAERHIFSVFLIAI
jgi:hypothetical protein